MDISIILVKPLYEGNVGSTARAMANFGFKNLILVKPCKIGKKAGDMAVHAKGILKSAKKFKSFEAAIKGFDLIVGTTAEKSVSDDHFLRRTINPKELRKKLGGVKGKVAIVFGPEDIGLTNDELERCDIGVTIPTAQNYKSMNLSHAVSIILYELSKATSYKLPAASPRLASKIEKDLMIKYFSEIMDKIDFPRPFDRRIVYRSMLNKLIGRSMITGREANSLLGVLRKVKKAVK
ncbi:TPA: RNA methyltransferase [archaeon]|nr:RNA methyltransferase [Candidatus Naiadarchaeales archaeon SRR2090153.bin461]